jgi:hypothetical protein
VHDGEQPSPLDGRRPTDLSLAATWVVVRSATLQRRTASTLKSGVNGRRGLRGFFRFDQLDHSGRRCHASWVVHESGEHHLVCRPTDMALTDEVASSRKVVCEKVDESDARGPASQ